MKFRDSTDFHYWEKELRHVIRGFNGDKQMRKLIKSISLIAKSLDDLLHKNVEFKGEGELKAFETLESKLTTAPILATNNPIDEPELHCNPRYTCREISCVRS